MKSVKHFLVVIVIILVAAFGSYTIAQDEIASVEVGESITTQYQVCGVFKSDRSLWVFKPGEPENVQSFSIGEEAHNFDQIAVGDLRITIKENYKFVLINLIYIIKSYCYFFACKKIFFMRIWEFFICFFVNLYLFKVPSINKINKSKKNQKIDNIIKKSNIKLYFLIQKF